MDPATRDAIGATTPYLTIYNTDTQQYEVLDAAAAVWNPLAFLTRGTFASATCAPGSIAQQFVTPGYGAVTVINGAEPAGEVPSVMQSVQGTMSRLRIRFDGDSANTIAMTVTFHVLKNGAAVAGALTAALPTNAAGTTSNINFAAVPVADGDRVSVYLQLSALLNVQLKNIAVAIS
jgi:hypothetical protein